MGSSLSHTSWAVSAVLFGLLFLVFDAARFFAQQVSAVTLRRWSTDQEQDGSGGWFRYDRRDLQLVSGALLQIALLIGFGSTIMAFASTLSRVPLVFAALIWIGATMAWKFALALVPDDVGEAILHALIPVTHLGYFLFWPLLFPLRRLLARIASEEDVDSDEKATDEEVRAYIDVGEEEGILEGPEGKLLQSIVEFGDRMARELMTPRIDVQAFDAHRPVEELARLFSESKYARIPIYEESIDVITGIVHIKDVFDVMLKAENRSVAELARPPYFISESKKASELLREFQSEHLQVAVIVDEYGGTAGIITIEDIVEEIVGDIADEHEDEEATIADLGDGAYLVSGQLRVEQLEEMLDADFEGDGYETIAGMIFTTLGRVPKVGAMVSRNGFQFIVDRADRRRIFRVKVMRDPDWKPDSDDDS